MSAPEDRDPATSGRCLPCAASPEAVVREFWRLMDTNDFESVGVVLDTAFVLEWPQSGELIRGAGRFAQVNAEYPAQGRWRFTLRRLVASDDEAVTEVDVTDGVQSARALSFFTLRDGKIVRLVEYWPEPYRAPANRAHLVEPLTSGGGLGAA
jgi:ketosteroid isomerase-like protein